MTEQDTDPSRKAIAKQMAKDGAKVGSAIILFISAILGVKLVGKFAIRRFDIVFEGFPPGIAHMMIQENAEFSEEIDLEDTLLDIGSSDERQLTLEDASD